MTQTETLRISRPDDWHLHLREGAMLKAVLAHTARIFGRAIAMPNLKPPVTSLDRAMQYRDAILASVSRELRFYPLMTWYLTDDTNARDIHEGFSQGLLTAAKLYPQHATTNSAAGVSDLASIRPVLKEMERIDMPLLIHGEVTSPGVDIFDREAVFLDRVLTPLLREYPGLRIVLEHITTRAAAQFVADGPATLAATITPQHLQVNRNAIFEGGIRPHYYCLPILKREEDRLALRKAATSGNPKFFLGTDSAPHARTLKEHACGCAGCFTAPVALELYAEVFEEEDALDTLEGFASLHGAAFYRLPVNTGTVRLEPREQRIPATVEIGDGETVVPFRAGESIRWTATLESPR